MAPDLLADIITSIGTGGIHTEEDQIATRSKYDKSSGIYWEGERISILR